MSGEPQTLSRVGIGTVQFGMDYGINNRTGRVPMRDVIAMLELAADRGINFLDTARAYGESETVLGRALDESRLRDRFVISTKLGPIDSWGDGSPPAHNDLVEAARRSVETSRRELRCDTLPVLLLHRPAHRELGGGAVWDLLCGLRERGVIGRLGVSAATGPGDLDPFLGDGVSEVMQIPFNAVDTRWARSGVLDRAAAASITLVTRSTVLQGLLLMDEATVAERLPHAAETHRRWLKLCADYAFEPLELAIRFALSEDRIESTILGVDSVGQFRKNLSYLDAGPLDRDLAAEIERRFENVDETVVNPARWPQHRP